MKTLQIIQTIIILLLVVLLAYVLILFKRKPIPYTPIQYIYDTLFIDKPYPVPKPYPVNVPAQSTIIYLQDQDLWDSFKILLDKKEIVISDLKYQVHISQNFLKQFPLNPKLIELDLSLDTLQLSLLNLDGIPSSSNYRLDLSEFQYKWTNEGLSQVKVNSTPTNKVISLDYFGGVGVNFLYFSPYINFSLETGFTRIKLYTDIKAGLLKKEASSINLGLKYRINK